MVMLQANRKEVEQCTTIVAVDTYTRRQLGKKIVAVSSPSFSRMLIHTWHSCLYFIVPFTGLDDMTYFCRRRQHYYLGERRGKTMT